MSLYVRIMYLCIHRHMEASGQPLVWLLKHHSSSYLFIFAMGSVAGLEHIKKGRLSGQGAPGSHLSFSNKEGCRWPITASFLMSAGEEGSQNQAFLIAQHILHRMSYLPSPMFKTLKPSSCFKCSFNLRYGRKHSVYSVKLHSSTPNLSELVVLIYTPRKNEGKNKCISKSIVLLDLQMQIRVKSHRD